MFNLKTFIHEKLLPDSRIKLALSNNFPGAADVEWSFKNNSYEATFTQEGIFKVASFDEGGKLKEEKASMLENQLPPPIQKLLHTKYRMLFLINALEITREGKKYFEVTVDSDDKSRFFLVFTEDGKVNKEQLLFAIKKDLVNYLKTGKKNNTISNN